MIRFITAGESHGQALTAIIEGFPAGLPVSIPEILADLIRRRQGYGRGGRMKIENDEVQILSGVRHGFTLGSPITLQILNKDWERWREVMAVEATGKSKSGKVNIEADERLKELEARVTRARPGHADLPGALKYHQTDLRNILERASARETAARVAVGAVARQFLREFDIKIFSGVLRIGAAVVSSPVEDLELYQKNVRNSPVAAPDPDITQKMIQEIDQAKENGNSLGGIIELIIRGVPPGLGSHVHWERRLDARLSYALMSIPAIKAVGFGLGFKVAELPGSEVHDPIYYETGKGFFRKTNNAGGIEGGISNGELIRIQLAMKPIPTLYQPLPTVDMATKQASTASVERSDVCAVPAAAVVAEAMACWVITEAFLEKYGGDHLDEIKANYKNYLKQMEKL